MIVKRKRLSSFSNAKNDNSGCVRNYILKLVQIASRLLEVNMEVTDDFVVHRVFYSLQLEYEELKVYVLLFERNRAYMS